MLKKILALLCVLTALVAIPLVTVSRVNAADTNFRVGYARVDINPYLVDGDFSSGIMELPLRGSGDVWNRISTYGLVDDNGDGKINEEDGLAATCIAVTDYNGETILMITVDLIGGGLIDEVREEICTRVEAAIAAGELQNVHLTPSQIHYAGTHTHNAPDTTVYSAKGKTGTNDAGMDLSIINKNLGIWIERTIEDIGDAAILALKDRAPATVTKDSLSAAQDYEIPVKGKTMNTVRHYNNAEDGCVAGDNFNKRGSNPKQVTKVDDTIYLVEFDFSQHNAATGENKLPVIMADWRGHPSLNNSDSYSQSSRNCMSSDYVNSFRHALEYDCVVNQNCTAQSYASEPSCRVAFFSGAGGNVNPRGYELVNGIAASKWIDNYATSQKDSRANGYGRVLAALAQHCRASARGKQAVSPGEIRSSQCFLNGTRRSTGINALAYEAALDFQAKYALDKSTKLPYKYTSSTGEYFVIGSRFHANNITSYWNAALQQPKDDLVSLEIDAFMLGNDLAFVTVAGEPFDYYYKELGNYTAANNLWNDLVDDDTYGKPIILGYCNGANGYVPNYEAYDYNLNSDKWMRGSYESNITPYPQGTGERMVKQFETMLDMLSDGGSTDRQAYCDHCGGEMTWQAYNGTATLDTGHYYLLGDTEAPQIHLAASSRVCFDLNGHTITGDRRVFYTEVNGKSTISLMDSSPDKTGVARGCGGTSGAASGFGGGTVLIDTGNTFNFYSGTMEAYEKGVYAVSSGGVLRVKGTVNMYGGTIRGGTASSFKGEYISSGKPVPVSRTGMGGTVHCVGTFNMYGGTIEAGKLQQITGTVTQNSKGTYIYSQEVTEITGKTPCMYASGKVTLSGNATVADIYFPSGSENLLRLDTEAAPYTGKLRLTYGTMLPDTGVIARCTKDTQLETDAISFADGELTWKVSGEKIVASAAAVLYGQDGSFRYYGTLQDAENAYRYSASAPSCIRMLQNTMDPLTVSQNTYLDLNGHYIGGSVTVSSKKTLYCMDSETDDYSVADGVYGKLTSNINGKVEPVPAMSIGPKASADSTYRPGYLKVTEPSGVSFHRIGLQLTSVALRPSVAGMYYTAKFSGDELVAQNVESFGLVLNATEEPYSASGVASQSNLYATYSGSEWGQQETYTSVVLSGVMKEENTPEVNGENAAVPVYGCAYAVVDGKTIYAPYVSWSLQELAQGADRADCFHGDALTQMLELYETFQSVMKSWILPRVFMAYEEISG